MVNKVSALLELKFLFWGEGGEVAKTVNTSEKNSRER